VRTLLVHGNHRGGGKEGKKGSIFYQHDSYPTRRRSIRFLGIRHRGATCFCLGLAVLLGFLLASWAMIRWIFIFYSIFIFRRGGEEGEGDNSAGDQGLANVILRVGLLANVVLWRDFVFHTAKGEFCIGGSIAWTDTTWIAPVASNITRPS